jgi:hypothetical protein
MDDRQILQTLSVGEDTDWEFESASRVEPSRSGLHYQDAKS